VHGHLGAVAVGSGATGSSRQVSQRARAVKVGSGRDAASEMGPVVTRDAQQRILGLIDSGEKQGAAIAVDGRDLVVPASRTASSSVPTVIDQVTTEMDVYQQEIFGRCCPSYARTTWTRRSR
jgi:malonate-semialdehyde dehydrogenase (acetylating)/methylmalonate-semialdehyde dehydrogenase